MTKKAIMAILAFFALLTIIAVVGVEAQPIGNETLGIVSAPAQPSSHGGYGSAINFLSLENPIAFSIERDGWDYPGGLGLYFYTIGISVDNGSIYRVTDSSRLNRTMQQLNNYTLRDFLVTNYHVTDLYNVTFSSLSAGQHQVTVYLGNGVGDGFYVYIYSSSSFVVDNQATPAPSPSPSPTLRPTVSILYPLNNSFFNVSIEGVNYKLIYETNSTLSWVGYSIGGNGYSIDGKGNGNVTVSENSTWVHDFGSNGYHTLTLYANDTSGNWATPQTVTYLVNLYPDYAPSPSPSVPEFPTWIILPLVATVTLLTGSIIRGKKKSIERIEAKSETFGVKKLMP
jgi:hypothetical protein